MQHYSTLKNIIGEKLLEMQNKGAERIVFYGVSDEMEIAYVTLQGLNLKLIGIVEDEDKMDKREVFGFSLKDVSQVGTLKPDAVLITSLAGQDEKKGKLGEFIDLQKVRIANISNP
jgi:hypothetical protein